MKAAIHNPYLDTLGGGERYVLTFAKVLAEEGYEVDIEWKDQKIVQSLEKRFGEKLNNNIKVIPDIKRGDGYDLCFWVSDGSIPSLKARKNILHFQVPFKGVSGNTLLNKMKLFRVDHIVCNSEFTRRFIDHEYGVESVVVYPPVDTKRFIPKTKENVILFVGRFSELLQSKGQEILVKEFKKFYDKGNRDWKLYLAGGVEVGVSSILDKIKKDSKGYPIKIITSPSFSDLKELYATSKIYWSATGYGVDEEKDPKKVEHFGITLVEAMSAGNVPVVFSAGGYKEIISDGENGFLWKKLMGLQKNTSLLAGNSELVKKMAKQARKSSEKFSYERFRSDIKKIL